MTTLGSLTVKLGLDPSQFRDGMATAEVELGVFKGAVDSNGSSIDDFSKKLLTGTKAVVGFAAKIGSFASAAISAAPYVVKAAQSVYSFGVAAVQASPMILGIAAAGLFVKETFTRIMPDILKSFNPFMQALTDAGNRAGLLASAGIAPLTQKFAQLNMPAISAGMNEIAASTNGVLKGTLAWTNSTAGIMAIRNIVQSTGDAFSTVAPHIQSVVIALGNMLGRITAVSTAAGASGLSGVLDKVAAYLDRVNAATVLKGIADLKTKIGEAVQFFKDIAHWVDNAIEFFKTFKTEIQLVGAALSILAIVTGGPVVAVIAAVGLIIKYWDQLKAAYQAFVGYFTQNPVGVGFLDNLRSASEAVIGPLKKAWDTIWTAIGPVLKEIWDKIKNQFIPAMGDFIAAIAPVVGFMVNVLGPIVASIWNGILTVISGVISVITGIIEVFTGLLTGDWSKVWEGIKTICSGAWEIIKGLFSGAVGALLGIISGAIEGIAGFFAGLAGRIISALGDFGNWLVGVGREVVNGLWRGISGGWDWLTGLVSGLAQRLLDAAKSALGIASPSKLFAQVGGNIGAGLALGITGSQGIVDNAMRNMTDRVSGASAQLRVPTPRGVATATGAAAGGGAAVVQLQGTDAILQLMRKLVRDNGGTADLAFSRRR